MKPISNDIKQELYTISPVIANLNNTNVYSIQPDYFSNLAEGIYFLKVLIGEKEVVNKFTIQK